MLLRSPLLVAHLCSFSRVVVSAGLTDISGLAVKAFDRLNRSKIDHLTLKMASLVVVETSVANRSPSQECSHPDDHFQPRYIYCSCI